MTALVDTLARLSCRDGDPAARPCGGCSYTARRDVRRLGAGTIIKAARTLMGRDGYSGDPTPLVYAEAVWLLKNLPRPGRPANLTQPVERTYDVTLIVGVGDPDTVGRITLTAYPAGDPAAAAADAVNDLLAAPDSFTAADLLQVLVTRTDPPPGVAPNLLAVLPGERA